MVQEALKMLAQILHEVVPIRNLRSLRQNLAHCLSKGARPITAHDLNFWMTGQPGFNRLSSPIRQEIEGAPCLKVDENGSIGVSSSQSKVINAQRGNIDPGGIFDCAEVARASSAL